ncbi:MAG: DUF5110 domain-containing protein [Anaerolineae bacterium]|nr:DUF5110 domain-containing protein [Anaerolineae bacterium]
MSRPIPDHFRLDTRPAANPAAIVLGDNVRFTVLTDRLFRLEFDPAGQFENRPSQAFWYRQQPVPPFENLIEPDQIVIKTDYLQLAYQVTPRGFTPETLAITLRSTGHTWHFGDDNPANLGGTTRTLDDVLGSTPLEPGLLSRAGWALVDDSRTLVFDADSWLEPRRTPAAALDLYFFGYGQDYQGCLQDYARITGPAPLLPRWALGNWWSRYWEYDEAELTALINDFKTNRIPLSVCIIDMDWHITDTGNTSTGWTGYTWNRALFPDPDRMIALLHAQGLLTSLNLHPAEGIHPHEAAYKKLAARLGHDPNGSEPIPFNIADPAFTQAYFEELHHPEEARGIDFWWMDWQQGTLTGLPGLDPLWWLNHLHFLDLGREGKRPFIFSRWGGLGNHRYPIGFSGDTYIAWSTLAFQPYFTATAANVGYGWWSHDIGGHHLGIEDPELYLRWIQFGVLSPIMRIHSTKNRYHERRPWLQDAETLRLTRQAMQFRHSLIPYLYTLAWRNHTEHQAPLQPMYHAYPEHEEAYHSVEQYLFGPELIAAPFTSPAAEDTRLSKTVVWLPDGEWYHFFTGERFAGGTWHAVYGTLEDMPLFARAGAIIPLAPAVDWGGVENPAVLDVHVFTGADGTFTLYEDDGTTTAYQEGVHALTRFRQEWAGSSLTFTFTAPEQHADLLPDRTVTLHLHGIREPEQIALRRDGGAIPFASDYDAGTETLRLTGIALPAGSDLVLTLEADSSLRAERDRTLEKCRAMIGRFALRTQAQQQITDSLERIRADPVHLGKYASLLTDNQSRALLETLFEVGIHHTQGIDCGDRFILWNNSGQQGLRYEFSHTVANDFVVEAGPFPCFRALVPEHIIKPVGRHHQVHAWRLRANFFDQVYLDIRREAQ